MSVKPTMEAVSTTVVTVWGLFSVPVYQATVLMAMAFSAVVRFVLFFDDEVHTMAPYNLTV